MNAANLFEAHLQYLSADLILLFRILILDINKFIPTSEVKVFFFIKKSLKREDF